MAACASTYLETGRSWNARVAERNAELLASSPCVVAVFARRSVTFPSDLITRVSSRRRTRCVCARCAYFTAALAVLFSLVMLYGLQHFSAIESGYRVEAEKQMVDQLREENRQLRLSEAQLSQPGRIDKMARELGLAEPQPGQVVHPTGAAEAGAPVLAQVMPPPSVVR